MATLQRRACLMLWTGILLLGGTALARADPPDPFADFLRCDSLLGQPTPAVSAALGPPPLARPFSPSPRNTLSRHVVFWTYSGPPGVGGISVLTLLFYDNTLVLASLQLPERDDPADAQAKLTGACRLCTGASRRMYYQTRQAEQGSKTPSALDPFRFSLNGTTQKGHTLRAVCSAGTMFPTIGKSVLSPTTGLYRDVFAPNPDFAVTSVTTGELTLAQGHGAPFELYRWSAASRQGHPVDPNPEFTAFLHNYMGGPIREPVSVLPMTRKNSPWLFTQ